VDTIVNAIFCFCLTNFFYLKPTLSSSCCICIYIHTITTFLNPEPFVFNNWFKSRKNLVIIFLCLFFGHHCQCFILFLLGWSSFVWNPHWHLLLQFALLFTPSQSSHKTFLFFAIGLNIKKIMLSSFSCLFYVHPHFAISFRKVALFWSSFVHFLVWNGSNWSHLKTSS
jgi:hypothetical protein